MEETNEHCCKKCKLKLTRHYNLKVHEQLCAGKIGHKKCTKCEKMYRQLNNFVVHFKKEHLDQSANKKKQEKDLAHAKSQWNKMPYKKQLKIKNVKNEKKHEERSEF